mmetsp:Transcript_12686/g.54479  ORF Transcript_12686/g.54479 Transcript_12686/m.54479 type:complete len:328 (-) Transcript_12686:173-1156(-)
MRDEVQGLVFEPLVEDFTPRVRLDLRKLKLGVVGVHAVNLLARGRPENFYNLNQLVHAGFAREQGLAQEQLSHDAPQGPYVDGGGVLRGAEDELGGAVVSRADVGDVGLRPDENLRAAKVAELELVRPRVHQQVLGLDVAVTDPAAVDVGQRPGHLVRVELHQHVRHPLRGLRVHLAQPVHGVRHKLEHEVQVHLLLLVRAVEAVLQADNVRVVQDAHDLQLAVLETLILQHLLDRDDVARLHARRLEHHAEGAIPDNLDSLVGFARRVGVARNTGGDGVAALVRVSVYVDSLVNLLPGALLAPVAKFHSLHVLRRLIRHRPRRPAP